MTGRTFASAKQALGYAVASRSLAAGPATHRESLAGPPPDPWLTSSIYACLRRAGLDPHGDCAVTRGVLAWATRSDDADDREDPKVGSAVRRVTAELEAAGIVCRPPSLERVGWRAVQLDGQTRIVSTTHLDADDVYLDRSLLEHDIAHGQVAPLEQASVELDPDAARIADIEDARAGLRHGPDLDDELARRWGCSPRTARRHRHRLGFALARGPKPDG